MKRLFRKWLKCSDANVAIEAGLLFPVMATLLLGTIDVGMGLTINEKVINACHTFADLLARQTDISDAAFSQAYTGSQLVMAPYSLTPFAYDVAGIQYINAALTPTVKWRNTCKMGVNTGVTAGSAGLGAQNEGVIAVTVKYTYTPVFLGVLAGAINMQEVSYARGRKGGFVTRTGNTTPCT